MSLPIAAKSKFCWDFVATGFSETTLALISMLSENLENDLFTVKTKFLGCPNNVATASSDNI